MPPITIMIKPVSGLCNMRCTYCFYTDEMNHRQQGSYGVMTEETLENVIRKTLAFAEDTCTIMYQGGEPTLAGREFFERSVEYQKQYNINNVKIENALQTNGLALDEEWCEFFAEHNFLIGLSVDGIKATHDIYRKSADGGDTYFKVLDAAKLLQKCKVEFNVLMVVNGKTAPKIGRIYEQFRKCGFAYQQYIPCLNPLGEQGENVEYTLKPETYGKFLIELFELWQVDLQRGTQPYIRQFENWVSILLGYLPEACDQRGVCGIQNIVEADGRVYPCDFYVLDGYCIGDLNSDSMEEIYENRETSGFIQDSIPRPEKCGNCPYFTLCRGGCRRYRTESEEHYNFLCAGYQMFFEKHYRDLVRIAETIKFGR